MFYITPQSWSILLCVHWRAAEAHQTQILFALQLSTAVKSSGFLTCYLEKTSSSLLVVFSSIDYLLTAGILTYGRKHKSPGDTLCTSNQGWQTGVSLHVQGYVMDRGIHTFWNPWAPWAVVFWPSRSTQMSPEHFAVSLIFFIFLLMSVFQRLPRVPADGLIGTCLSDCKWPFRLFSPAFHDQKRPARSNRVSPATGHFSDLIRVSVWPSSLPNFSSQERWQAGSRLLLWNSSLSFDP